ncbi:Signal transduction histidine kinase [Monaibacterium marinum]|uniref:histidine kinase n=1 Tax=Pontivivens marinum TaxID=1690039 RepID=A0A2C9CU13_9RHOB|nr:ATP-binding protein [Monaibacterium marinum]SOH93879.1 Signal transduction histidine kinase [Monaibacterium marinum]
MSQLKGNFYRHGRLISVLAAAITGIALFLYVGILYQGITRTQLQWNTFSASQAEVSTDSYMLKTYLGYGGMIHNFKNYIIRQDPEYAERTRHYMDLSTAIIKKFQANTTDENELRILGSIESVVTEYAQKLLIAEDGIARGLSVSEIDQLVQVDDTNALVALDFISRQVVVDQRSTQIDTQESIDFLSRFISLGGVILLLIVSALSWMSWYLIGALKFAYDEKTAALDRAEAASLARLRFIATLSHEIRTPLGGLLGMINLLDAKETDPEKRELLEFAAGAGSSLNRIVDDVLDFSKLDSGAVQFKMEPVDIRSITEGVITLTKLKSDQALDRMTSSIDDHVPAYFVGDATRIRQVLANLVGNAVRYSRSGPITVYVHEITKRGRTILRVEVEDHGVGISTAEQLRLFADFSQVPNELTAAAKGAGMGLAISKRIVEGLGGRIGVESTAGQGSTFWFELPIKHTDAPPPALATPDEMEGLDGISDANGARVLLVEDNVINRKILSTYLIRMGVDVEIAENGRIAIEKFSPNQFDLILMDLAMPEMDGLTAIRFLLSNWKPEQIPDIFVLTAHSMEQDQAEALAAGAKLVLLKPISFESLKEYVEPAIMRNRRAIQLVERAAVHDRHLDADAPIRSVMSEEALENLLDIYPATRVLELVEKFITDGRHQLADITGQFAAGNTADASQHAHNLKGAAGMLGFATLVELADVIESSADDLTTEEIDEIATLISAELDEISTTLNGPA